MSLYVLAALPVVVWLYLLLARGGFWRVASLFAPLAANAALAKTVVAIIPARNEAPVIGDAVRSLLQQIGGGSMHVIVIDDGSTDGTRDAALEAAAALDAAAPPGSAAGPGLAARLSVLTAPPPPPGWSGKVWAMSQGVAAARQLNPDYLLFTDADIHHDPEELGMLVSLAEARQADLVSCMVELQAVTTAEKWLIPAFVFFFLKLYPPAWIAAPHRRTAGAAGGCMLLRPQAIERIGGLRSLRSEIIDDCALARAIKHSGGSIWLGLTRSARSTRPYGSIAEIGRMISRTAFNQLRHSWLLLAATLLGLLVTYLLPPLLLLSGHWLSMALGAAAWMLMCIAYTPMLRFYRRSPIWSLGLPAVALFYAAATAHSAVQYGRGRGGQWKGRAQDVRIRVDEPAPR
jgi:hopene-associated glycosyltransferase HpnB